MVRVSMFKMNIGKSRGLSEKMFELNPEQQKIVRKNLALPKVTGWINQCISEGNFDENAKNAYMKLIADYEIRYDIRLLQNRYSAFVHVIECHERHPLQGSVFE